MFTQASGVGPKLAGRIVQELTDKVATIEGPLAGIAAAPPAAAAGALDDAVSALVNLGYRRGEAFGAVTQAARDLGDDAEVQALIRAGLRELGQGGGPAQTGAAR